jgi:predicted Zn-dependent peptidase
MSKVLRFCSVLLLVSLSAPSQDVREFEKRITEFTLANGLHFIVMERHEAPVVSFHTYVSAGSVNDPSGLTGLAHMFEHMAFKGTDVIGTTDWPDEKKALEEVDSAYARLQAERNKGRRADPGAIKTLETQFNMAVSRAQTFVRPNEYARIIEQNGGVGLNASTGVDATQYFYSLPSNRIELWFLMESQRFIHPVFREFYKERDVVMEERRMRVESSAQGQLVEEFRADAFEAHPYRNPPGGWASDIPALSRPEAQQFFETYYAPANITIAIVGDVDPVKAKSLAEAYFGPVPARPLPPVVHTQEPPQVGPKLSQFYSPAQPLLIEGYKRPDQYDKDDPVFDIAAMILSSGRTSIMYKDLVQEKRIAVDAEAIPTFPGGRYPNLFVLFIMPAQGHSVDEDQKAVDDLVQRLKTQKVDAEALERVKAQARVGVLQRLDNNSELAAMFSSYYANFGDWRKLFTTLDDYKKVTADDIQRVARRYFITQNRTVSFTVVPQAAHPQTAQPQPAQPRTAQPQPAQPQPAPPTAQPQKEPRP